MMLAASRDVCGAEILWGENPGPRLRGGRPMGVPDHFSEAAPPRLRRVDTFEAFAIGRHSWPRLFAALLLAALVFLPKPTYGLIEAEAKHRAREYTALLMEAVFPDAKSQGHKRAVGRRGDLTGAPTGARLPYRSRPAHP
jgi:hypothetical protein